MAISSDLLAELDAYRGGRYPQSLKLSIGKYIRTSRNTGVTWYSLCLELSLPRQTVKAWSDLVSKAPKLVPVRIPETIRRSSQVTLVSPAGWRLEDVDAELAARLIIGVGSAASIGEIHHNEGTGSFSPLIIGVGSAADQRQQPQ